MKSMKTILSAFVLVIWTSVLLTAQSLDTYKAHNEGWMVSIEKAQAISKESGKPIMANFTGSDWCGWCKRLTANVFSKPEFKEWAKDNVVLLELDFPRRTKLPSEIQAQNQSLQRAFQVTGYPTVWVFYLQENAQTGQIDINPIGRTGYKPSAKEFIDEVEGMIARSKS
ncbi:MAG TPA: thioredoxin family protein [Membranihabitans sp.]|nr:thioredoxin family protein [Membranihabitans sp.]